MQSGCNVLVANRLADIELFIFLQKIHVFYKFGTTGIRTLATRRITCDVLLIGKY